MTYTVQVLTTTEGSELVSAFLLDMGAEGVSIRDKKDLDDLVQNRLKVYWDYIDESAVPQEEDVIVVGYFQTEPTSGELEALKEQLSFAKDMMPVDMGKLAVSVAQNTEDENWYENWKKYYHPIDVDKLTVLPVWEENAREGQTVVRINPNMAFGTGDHETTRLCLKLMQTVGVKDKQIIDVGCGSGILGIAALKLGAKHCYFADIDPDAMRNMEENASLNGVTAYEARTAGLLDGCDYVADVMLANITADILIALSHDAKRCLKSGGAIIVSGVTTTRADDVKTAFEQAGFEMIDRARDKDWVAMVFSY